MEYDQKMSLKVVAGVCRRGVKELEMYREEVRQGEAKLAALPKDDNFYSQTQNALEESRTMVGQTKAKLVAAYRDLETKLDETSPLHQEALEIIAQAKQSTQ